jgi:hypothetical protein
MGWFFGLFWRHDCTIGMWQRRRAHLIVGRLMLRLIYEVAFYWFDDHGQKRNRKPNARYSVTSGANGFLTVWWCSFSSGRPLEGNDCDDSPKKQPI